MSRILRSLLLAAISVSAVTLSTSALADRGKWRHDDDDHGRWEHRHRYDDDRWVPPGHRWGHRHRIIEERVVIEEPARVYVPAPRVYLPPPPVVYRPARPAVTISVPDIIIPF